MRSIAQINIFRIVFGLSLILAFGKVNGQVDGGPVQVEKSESVHEIEEVGLGTWLVSVFSINDFSNSFDADVLPNDGELKGLVFEYEERNQMSVDVHAIYEKDCFWADVMNDDFDDFNFGQTGKPHLILELDYKPQASGVVAECKINATPEVEISELKKAIDEYKPLYLASNGSGVDVSAGRTFIGQVLNNSKSGSSASESFHCTNALNGEQVNFSIRDTKFCGPSDVVLPDETEITIDGIRPLSNRGYQLEWWDIGANRKLTTRQNRISKFTELRGILKYSEGGSTVTTVCEKKVELFVLNTSTTPSRRITGCSGEEVSVSVQADMPGYASSSLEYTWSSNHDVNDDDASSTGVVLNSKMESSNIDVRVTDVSSGTTCSASIEPVIKSSVLITYDNVVQDPMFLENAIVVCNNRSVDLDYRLNSECSVQLWPNGPPQLQWKVKGTKVSTSKSASIPFETTAQDYETQELTLEADGIQVAKMNVTVSNEGWCMSLGGTKPMDVLKFFERCYEGWMQDAGERIVPACVWQEAHIANISGFSQCEVAFICGIMDAIYKDLLGIGLLVVDLSRVGDAWFTVQGYTYKGNITTIHGTNTTYQQIRDDTWPTMVAIYEAFATGEIFRVAYNGVSELLGSAYGASPEACYNQGKVAYHVASIALVVKDIAVAAKGANLAAKTAAAIKALPGLIKSVPSAFLRLGTKLSELGMTTVRVITNNIEYLKIMHGDKVFMHMKGDVLIDARYCMDYSKPVVQSIDDVIRYQPKKVGSQVNNIEFEVVKDGAWYALRPVNKDAGVLFGKIQFVKVKGFVDDLARITAKHGTTPEEFLRLQQKSFESMTTAERALMKKMRLEVPMPNTQTILQKVIPSEDIAKYLDGTYDKVGGFISTAKDSKHLKSYDDIFDGMRLDYEKTRFIDGGESCAVIRYKVDNTNGIEVAKSILNGGMENSPMPFTGHGFTSGKNGNLGVPEWKSPYLTPKDGAEVWEVFADGTEILRAKYSAQLKKFISIN